MRIASLVVPDFPLQALRRSAPELAETPIVIAAGGSPRDTLLAVSAEAAELGARRGMTVAQARQVAPSVGVRVTPLEVAAAADEALADVAASFSPRVKRCAAGEVVLDASGLTPRWRSEERLGHEVLRACHRVGLAARIGIASSVGVARVASRIRGDSLCRQGGGSGQPPGSDSRTPDPGPRTPFPTSKSPASPAPPHPDLTVIPSGDERSFLAFLPLRLLAPPPELEAALARWGLRRAGDLTRLRRDDVALRLGPQGLALHRLACGEDDEAFIPDPLRETLREGIALEHALISLEPFLFLLRDLLSRLERRLELRGVGFAEVSLELHLEGGGRHEVCLKMVAPTREVPAVLAMARLQLEAHPPGEAVDGITAQVTAGKVRLTQGSLFGPRMPAPGKLAMTLARLGALVGPDRLGAPALSDTHRPGAWAIAPFAPSPAEPRPDPSSHAVDGAGRGSSHLAASAPVLRAFRPPREARVVAVGGRPVAARTDGLGGTVVAWAGPYRFTGEWWGDDPFARDDFDVATSDGSLLRVFLDRRDKRWFVDGIYD